MVISTALARCGNGYGVRYVAMNDAPHERRVDRPGLALRLPGSIRCGDRELDVLHHIGAVVERQDTIPGEGDDHGGAHDATSTAVPSQSGRQFHFLSGGIDAPHAQMLSDAFVVTALPGILLG